MSYLSYVSKPVNGLSEDFNTTPVQALEAPERLLNAICHAGRPTPAYDPLIFIGNPILKCNLKWAVRAGMGRRLWWRMC